MLPEHVRPIGLMRGVRYGSGIDGSSGPGRLEMVVRWPQLKREGKTHPDVLPLPRRTASAELGLSCHELSGSNIHGKGREL
jgi:hypothetical protein